MSPKAVGIHSDWSFGGDTPCNRGKSLEWVWVWSGLTSVGVIGGHDAMGLSRAGHVILEGFYVPKVV